VALHLHCGAMMKRSGLLFFAATAVVVLAFAGAAPAQEKELTQIKERELEAVREKINDLKKSMDRRAAERDRITGELQAAEIEIAEKRVVLRDLERQRNFSEKKKAELDLRLQETDAELASEAELLAAQVEAAYMSGAQERLKLLLNQHDPATLGRLMTYYRYMSEYRGANIESVNSMILELKKLHHDAAEEENRIAGLARARTAELSMLDESQRKRAELLASLKARIDEEGSEIKRLAEQEQDLTRLIAELTSILSDYPITSEEQFSKFKGRLTWPIAGRLIHDFGQPRAGGQLKWNGVVLAAPRGREVRSVYHGRVIFADWLAGMGLLVIVDHGENYMSLYGYNEATLKSAGDWVAPGDVIATVGDSGGQAQAGLYFEIRQGTKPVNPRSWVSRQPASN
jgi:septal ring factor EnvC (AmiA/AmiB activator)